MNDRTDFESTRKIEIEIESYVREGKIKWSYHIKIRNGPPFVMVGFTKDEIFRSLIASLKRIKDEYV